MARGGFRPGAGRRVTLPETEANCPADIVRAATNAGVTPLEYMLGVMRSPDVDPARRDRMAAAAAPYCHSRVADQRVGKKETQRDAAKRAFTDWNGDIDLSGLRRR